jgi:hypothetical protein
MDTMTTPRFWMPEQVSVDFHRHIYVIAHRMKQPYGYDLKRERFWLLDRGKLLYYGLRIQTDFGFEPYRVIIGDNIEVGGYTSFSKAYWGLIAIRNELAIQHRHVRYFGHPWTEECDALDCVDEPSAIQG